MLTSLASITQYTASNTSAVDGVLVGYRSWGVVWCGGFVLSDTLWKTQEVGNNAG